MTTVSEPQRIPKGSTFKQWAFRMIVYLFVINCFLFWDTSHHAYIDPAQAWRKYLLMILSLIFFSAGVIFTLFSHFRKEKRDYQFKIPAWGFVILTILSIALPFIQYLLVN